MKIAIIETGMPQDVMGGAELQAWRLAKGFSEKHEVILFTKMHKGREREEFLEGVNIVRSGVAAKGFLAYVVYVFDSCRRIIVRSKNVNVLLCFRATPSGVIGKIVNILTGIPYCISVRGGDWYFVKRRMFGMALLGWVYRSASRIVVQAQAVLDDIRNVMPEYCPVVIPNGVDSDDRQAIGDAVVFVGSLYKRKGVDVLLCAARILQDVKFVIVGDGPERDALCLQCIDLKNVEFVGAVKRDNVKDVLVERGRVFVLPATEGEGLPNVLLEAMSVGLPVVASDIAGIKDLLMNGDAGVLIAPGDCKMLIEAIRKLLDNDDLSAEIINKGREVVLAHNWDYIIERYEVVLLDVAIVPDENKGVRS